MVADSHESLTDALSQKPVVSMADPKKTGLAFIFTGQGAQWARMGAELMHYPIFTKSVQEADAYLKALGSEWSGQGKIKMHNVLTLSSLIETNELFLNYRGAVKICW